VANGVKLSLGLHFMTKEQLLKMLTDTSEMDPWLFSNFFEPLLTLQEITERLYQMSAPPKRYWEARVFAKRLWECCDNDDARELVSGSREGAAQFCYLISLLVLERTLPHLAQSGDIEPKSDKPFAALASRALEWLDEVEKKAPGKTMPPT
jgi:hypothetical protein